MTTLIDFKTAAMKKRILLSTVTSTVDRETGEIVSESKTDTMYLSKEPNFIKMYIDDICYLTGVADAHKNILLLLLKGIDYDGYINVSSRLRKVVCEELTISDGTFRNRLSALCKSGLLTRTLRSEYQVNPNYFARGTWDKVSKQRKQFEINLKYNQKSGRTIETRVVD